PVGFLAVGTALVRRHLTDLLEGHDHRALLAEVLRVPGAQVLFVGAACQLGEGVLFQGSEVRHDVSSQKRKRQKSTRRSGAGGPRFFLLFPFSLVYAGAAARERCSLANSAIWVKVAGSLTARSASVLRSSWT